MNGLGNAHASSLEVGEDGEAQRIDNFLLRRLKGVPKSHVYRLLRSGQVRVNSGRVKPEYRLRLGDRVRVPPVRLPAAPRRAAPKLLELPVVYEDAALLVVDKPPGIAVHGGSGVSYGAIESLRAARPQARVLELAHRLDRETSGLLMIAKKRSALLELHRLLRASQVEKTYVAIVQGQWPAGERLLDASLHKYVTASGERRVRVREGGQQAATHVRRLAATPQFSLLAVRLLTGRTHQIRVHLAHAGHPVLGDGKYGDFEANRALAKQGVKRLMLHAYRLALPHPSSGERLELEAPWPPPFRDFVATHFPGHAP